MSVRVKSAVALSASSPAHERTAPAYMQVASKDRPTGPHLAVPVVVWPGSGVLVRIGQGYSSDDPRLKNRW
jgi:hypothetical protein